MNENENERLTRSKARQKQVTQEFLNKYSELNKAVVKLDRTTTEQTKNSSDFISEKRNLQHLTDEKEIAEAYLPRTCREIGNIFE